MLTIASTTQKRANYNSNTRSVASTNTPYTNHSSQKKPSTLEQAQLRHRLYEEKILTPTEMIQYPSSMKVINDRYVLNKQIGKGAQAEVYLAYDLETSSLCAIKKISPHLADDAKTVQRFQSEAQIMIDLPKPVHPNIASVFNISTENNESYIVMELITGGTLHDAIDLYWSNIRNPEFKDEERELLFNDMLLMIASIFRALDYVHNNGIVHRDVKPKNILLKISDDFTKPPTAKLTDFGLSLKHESLDENSLLTISGTLYYISPDQLTRSNPDGRADFYSLGAVLYELVNGMPPFPMNSPSIVINHHLNIKPEFPDPLNVDTSQILRMVDIKSLVNSIRAILHKGDFQDTIDLNLLRKVLNSNLDSDPILNLDNAKILGSILAGLSEKQHDSMLNTIILKLLEKDPSARYQSGEEVAILLENIVSKAL